MLRLSTGPRTRALRRAAAGCLVGALGFSVHHGCGASRAREPPPVLEVLSLRPIHAAPSVSATPPPPNDAPRPSTASRPCPEEMALVPARAPFCIDRWEAALARELDDGSREMHAFTERPRQGERYRAVSRADVFPQAYISRVEASAACEAAGKRLCTRTEWQRACRRDGRAVYPYGDARDPGACNSGKPPLLPLMFPQRGYSFHYEEHFNSPALDLEPGYLAKTGEHARCATELGVLDMVGNLHEWVSDDVTRGLLTQLEAEGPRQWQPATPGNGVFMGGFYSTTGEHGAGCGFTTVAHDPGYHDYSTGFRCCTSPDRAGL